VSKSGPPMSAELVSPSLSPPPALAVRAARAPQSATASVSAIGRLSCPWLHTSIALHDAVAADHVVVTQCLVRRDVSAGGLVDFYMACNWLLMLRCLQILVRSTLAFGTDSRRLQKERPESLEVRTTTLGRRRDHAMGVLQWPRGRSTRSVVVVAVVRSCAFVRGWVQVGRAERRWRVDF